MRLRTANQTYWNCRACNGAHRAHTRIPGDCAQAPSAPASSSDPVPIPPEPPPTATPLMETSKKRLDEIPLTDSSQKDNSDVELDPLVKEAISDFNIRGLVRALETGTVA